MWEAPRPQAEPTRGVSYSSLAFTRQGKLLNLYMRCDNQTDHALCRDHELQVIGVAEVRLPYACSGGLGLRVV